METTFDKIRIVGNVWIAQPGIERHKIKKNFKNGGGILGGCLKAGDRVKVTSACSDIDTMSFSTDITLHRLNSSFFYTNEFFKRES